MPGSNLSLSQIPPGTFFIILLFFLPGGGRGDNGIARRSAQPFPLCSPTEIVNRSHEEINVLVSFPAQAAPRCLPPCLSLCSRLVEEPLSSDTMQEQMRSLLPRPGSVSGDPCKRCQVPPPRGVLSSCDRWGGSTSWLPGRRQPAPALESFKSKRIKLIKRKRCRRRGGEGEEREKRCCCGHFKAIPAVEEPHLIAWLLPGLWLSPPGKGRPPGPGPYAHPSTQTPHGTPRAGFGCPHVGVEGHLRCHNPLILLGWRGKLLAGAMLQLPERR